jgi:hypothetical protein
VDSLQALGVDRATDVDPIHPRIASHTGHKHLQKGAGRIFEQAPARRSFPLAPCAWAVTDTRSANAMPQSPGMGSIPLSRNVSKENYYSSETTRAFASIGRDGKVAKVGCTIRGISAQDAPRSLMALRDALARRSRAALTPYKSHVWEEFLLQAGLLEIYPTLSMAYALASYSTSLALRSPKILRTRTPLRNSGKNLMTSLLQNSPRVVILGRFLVQSSKIALAPSNRPPFLLYPNPVGQVNIASFRTILFHTDPPLHIPIPLLTLILILMTSRRSGALSQLFHCLSVACLLGHRLRQGMWPKHTEQFRHTLHSGRQLWSGLVTISMGWTLRHPSARRHLQAFMEWCVMVELISSVLRGLGRLCPGLTTTFSFAYDGNFLLNTTHDVNIGTETLLRVVVIRQVEGCGLGGMYSTMGPWRNSQRIAGLIAQTRCFPQVS